MQCSKKITMAAIAVACVSANNEFEELKVQEVETDPRVASQEAARKI